MGAKEADSVPPSLEELALRLNPRDNVAIAKVDLEPGTVMTLESGARVQLRQSVPSGHKLALEEIPAGRPVRRYGQVIGCASRAIRPGDYVHTHNVGIEDLAQEHAFGVDARPVELMDEAERRTFQGYVRADGRVGTRNYIAVISTVNCSAHASREIARHFTAERLDAYPNVDGVIAFTHHTGCTLGCESRDYRVLQRTLAGMARHPNVGASLLVGLGCETNQVSDLVANCGLCVAEAASAGCPQCLVIQELGGIRPTVEAGIAAVEELLPQVNDIRRMSQPISELTLALQCGGSDSWSGVTANPVVGLVADEVVRQGGTVVLAETPEIFGAEHLLTRRAINSQVGRRLLDQVGWWETYAQRIGVDVDNNRSVGNEAGGLTTIYEKSLGAIAKAGSSPLIDVYDYAEPVRASGFVFMNSPGYDPVSVTGQVAGGCNLVLFTTGRGSVFGFKPAPSIKISTNSVTYERMPGDVDLNAGRVLEGESMDQVASELLDLVVAVASGQPSKSEIQGVGEAEFVPWTFSGML